MSTPIIRERCSGGAAVSMTVDCMVAKADELPRSSTALPLLSARPAASTVTLGRAS